MDQNESHPYFIENGESRHETAVLLVGTAEEEGLDQREIRATQDGFRVSERLAQALGYTDDEEPVTHDEDGFPVYTDKDKPENWNDMSDTEKHAYVYGDVLTGQVKVAQPDGTTPAEINGNTPVVTGDAEPVSENSDGEPDTEDDVAPYEEWDYADLKAEVAKREIEVPNQKSETLVAALNADDESDES